MIFPTFGNNIGCLQSLFKKDFSNLPLTEITSSPSKNGSKWEILLLLSSDLLSHWNSSQILTIPKASLLHHLYQPCFCFFQQAGFKQSCTFYFPNDAMLIDLGKQNFLELDYQCNSSNNSGPVWYSIFESCQNICRLCGKTHNKFFLQLRIGSLLLTRGIVVIPGSLWFLKKLWSKIPPFNFVIITNTNPSSSIICWVLLWVDIMPLGFIWMIFDEFSSFSTNNLK